MRSSLRTNGLCLALFWFLSPISAAAQELRISHQFHAENDSRGRAAQVFAAEVARRVSDLKISVHPQLSIGLTRDGQLRLAIGPPGLCGPAVHRPRDESSGVLARPASGSCSNLGDRAGPEGV